MTYIKPSLISGLNALVLDEISKKALIDQEKYLLRRIFKFRPKVSTTPFYLIIGILPILTSIDQAKLALFHNIWITRSRNKEPVYKRVRRQIGPV